MKVADMSVEELQQYLIEGSHSANDVLDLYREVHELRNRLSIVSDKLTIIHDKLNLIQDMTKTLYDR